LMIAPATILIFTFGIFPVGFALYVSLHKWKIKQGDFLGLSNFIKAVDSLAYLLFFLVVIGFAYIAWRSISQVISISKKHNENPWLLNLPSILHAAAGLLLLRYIVVLLPEILSVADKVRNVERTNELFLQLLGDAFRAEMVMPAFYQWLGTWVIAWVLTAGILKLMQSPRSMEYLAKITITWFFALASIIVGWFTIKEINRAILESLESGEPVAIWVQIITISAGVVLLFLSWQLWKGAIKKESNSKLFFQGFASLLLLAGGWLLIAEIPVVIQAGDKDLWSGLKVTIFYSTGTIPFQLSISLILAFLLFQDIRGKETFRMLFFLPYITPAVASAAVFTLLFSPRPSAVVNKLFSALGSEPQRWLFEPQGVFKLLAKSIGIETFPSWAEGPSLALVVIIIYSIWVYVGYDVVIYLAGLGNISNEINEAAAIDGASRWDILRHITLPLLSPTIYFLSLVAVIGTFKAFNHVYVMRDSLALGTVDTFSVVIFEEFFTHDRYGYASAMAFVLFAVILSLTYINNKIQGSRVFYG